MKKIMYCACVAALATACTNEDLIQENGGSKSKGIVFEAAIPAGAVETRGELTSGGISEAGNKLWNFFWYAEQDRVNVYADNVKMVTDDAEAKGVVTDWNSVGTPAVYKATKSASKGQFTGVDDNNWIGFQNSGDNAPESNFVLTYPTTTTIKNVNYETVRNVVTVKGVDLVVGESNAEQTVRYNETKAPMYSIAKGKADKSYESVGEVVALDFTRPFPVVRFSSVKENDAYNQYLGGLKSITMTMKGEKADENAGEATKISYAANSEFTKNDDGVWSTETEGTGSTVKVNLSEVKVWNSEDQVFMNIAPVKREKKVEKKTVAYTEQIEVTYEYENVSLTTTLESANPWTEEHSAVPVPALNISRTFPWIVTNEGRTLIVFSGSFDAIFDAKSGKIKWDSEEDGTVELSEITKIVVSKNATISNSQLQGLDKFENLTSLTLNGVATIPANTFDESLTGLTELILPDVTTIENAGNGNFSALINLDLSSYEFSVAGIETKFFNDNVKETLTTLDIAAVTSLRPIFGTYREIGFEGYTKLERVELNPEKVALTTSAFKGCTSLNSVTGVVEIDNAPNAFEGTSALETVNVAGDVIPNAAFKNSGVKDILLNGTQVVPSEVGEYAFYGNTAVVEMDLSKTTKIGDFAFSGASSYKGMTDGSNAQNAVVLTVGAETVGAAAFQNTAIEYAQFMNVTSLPHMMFAENTALKQVKFLQVVELGVKPDGYTLASPFMSVTTGAVDLFVVKAQNDVNGNTWNLVNKAFKSITKEDLPWGATE